ncbi:TPA: hypothetical protein ACGAD2_005228 [Salmonella enterica subsp. enterica serovar Newport]|nr:hypothetical protein DOE63_04090 [Salmonella enterica subsp. diarizonae serovar 59:z10:-]MDJ3784089.1 hypothetical protein [Salmonella enterica]
MTKEQMETIVAMLAGQQAAIIHLSILFAQHAGTDKESLADSFRENARLLGAQTRNKEVISLVLNQIASGISASTPETHESIKNQIKNLLH